jgi:uncharacterized protein YlxP (DUF503 family)
MLNLFVGVAHISLNLRHSRSLKDKRQVFKSLTQKLRNQGFSVTEAPQGDNIKQGSLGLAYVGTKASVVETALREGLRMFIGDFEVIDSRSEIFDYSSDNFEIRIPDDPHYDP